QNESARRLLIDIVEAPRFLNTDARQSSWRPIMKKLSMLGIIGGAALLTAVPFSLQWSQKNVALSRDSAEARIGRPLTATSVAGVSRRVHRRAYRRAVYGTAVAGLGGYSYYRYSSPAYTSYTAPYSYSYSAPYRYGYSAPYLGYSAPYFGYSPYF